MLEIKVTKAAGQNACEEQATADVKGILRRRKREQTLWLAWGSREIYIHGYIESANVSSNWEMMQIVMINT